MSPSAPILIVNAPGRTTLRLVLTEATEIGRACPGLLLDDPAISRRHLEVAPTDKGVRVRDLESANGTTLDGAAVTGSALLTNTEQVVRLGDVTIRLAETGVNSTATDTSPEEVDEASMTAIERVATAVVAESLDGALAVGTTQSIVFSDIESSTELAVAHGDIGWFDLLKRHNEVLRDRLRTHGGVEVKSQGDGFMLTFPSARGAVAYMVEVQRALTDDPVLAEAGVCIRIGAHTGEALESDGDLFGQAVIAAARVGAAANGGEVLVSSLVREIVESWGEHEFDEPRTLPLKGLPGEWTVHPVRWRRDPD